MQTTAWQVTIHRGSRTETHNVFADSVHEARMLGSRISPRPNADPSRVIDVCLLEVVLARKSSVTRAL